MQQILSVIYALAVSVGIASATPAQTDSIKAPTGIKAASCPTQTKAATPALAPASPKPPRAASAGDTLIIDARIVEIAGTFAPNDLYNYVYIMKYRVLKVVKGVYTEQDILVGHYNPLIPRAHIKDDMKKYVSGNAPKFEVGAKHKLVLVTPIEKVWQKEIEDEYIDSDLPKFFALRTDVIQ
jgi:hypothetical protein